MKSSLVLFFILLITAISISNKESDITPEENQYLLHAESSDRLLSIMQQISLLANSQNRREEVESFKQEDISDLIEAVEELLFYAELMSIKVPATELEESKAVIFSALASQLYDEALNIQQIAKTYDLHIVDYAQENILNEAFTRLSQTCSACHQLFRDN